MGILRKLCCAGVGVAVVLVTVAAIVLFLQRSNSEHLEENAVSVEDYETFDPWNVTESPTAANTTREPPILSDTYYFPFIGTINVTFADAKHECDREYSGHELANLPGTNVDFLKRTAHLVGNASAPAVWMGGYFRIASRYPYLVYWSNGNVSDALKSPKNIWCAPPEQVILQIRELAKERKYKKLFLPIIRSRANSSCLTIYVNDIFSDVQSQFPPLCMKKVAAIQIENMEPKYFKKFLKWGPRDKHLAKKHRIAACDKQPQSKSDDYIKCMEKHQTLDAEYPLRYENRYVMSAYRNFLLVGYPELMSYEYAGEICIPDELKPSWTQALGPFMFQHFENENIPVHKNSFLNAEKTFFEVGSPIIQAYFDFELGFYGNTTALMFPSKESIDPTDIGYSWCVDSNSTSSDPMHTLAMLRQHYDEFRKWYDDVGKKTSGPYKVHVTFDIVQREPCLKAVMDDLYWPGAKSWLPACLVNVENQRT